MQSRRSQIWVWWLLPLMAARAMLPAGFMPAMGAAGLQLKLCSVSFLQQDEQRHAPADSKHAELVCPFAHAGGAAPLTTAKSPAVVRVAEIDDFAPAAQLEISYGPPRIDRVRGPPPLV